MGYVFWYLNNFLFNKNFTETDVFINLIDKLTKFCLTKECFNYIYIFYSPGSSPTSCARLATATGRTTGPSLTRRGSVNWRGCQWGRTTFRLRKSPHSGTWRWAGRRGTILNTISCTWGVLRTLVLNIRLSLWFNFKTLIEIWFRLLFGTFWWKL